MRGDIAKKVLVLLTGLTLAQVTKAETDLGFRLISSTLREGKPMLDQQVLDSFGCTGRNQSPDLRWMHAPSGTKSFAITLYALDIDKLGVGEAASPAMIGFAMHRHILAKAVLAVTYGR